MQYDVKISVNLATTEGYYIEEALQVFSLEASCLLYMQFQPGIYTSRSDPDLQDMTHALTHPDSWCARLYQGYATSRIFQDRNSKAMLILECSMNKGDKCN